MTRQAITKQMTARQVMARQVVMLGMTVVLTAGLSACSDVRRAIGDGKSAPDEFQVVVRAPLSLPPGFGDSPEDIVKSSQTSGVDAQTGTAKLLGSQIIEGSEFAGLFDFSGVPDDIRTKVDEETYGIQLEKRLPLQTLFGGVPDVGPVLDKMAEDLRLRKARLAGQAPTEGGTKAIDPASNQPLSVN
ncbi:DUF3035 domain-containing protein [Alphaproteobacteria bacterium]|jgi:hypothetical protein|nr:DUF3035 domain-containing protein [Alphaproteobacteria bacterium]